MKQNENNLQYRGQCLSPVLGYFMEFLEESGGGCITSNPGPDSFFNHFQSQFHQQKVDINDTQRNVERMRNYTC